MEINIKAPKIAKLHSANWTSLKADWDSKEDTIQIGNGMVQGIILSFTEHAMYIFHKHIILCYTSFIMTS